MNCRTFMFNLNLDFRVTISIFDVVNGIGVSGDVTVPPGDWPTAREMWCNETSRLHRLGPFCERFKLSPYVFDSSGLSGDAIFTTFASPHVQPRPWDENDPYFPRAAAVWDHQTAGQKQLNFVVAVVGDYFYGGTFADWKDGASAEIYGAVDLVGTATLTLKNK